MNVMMSALMGAGTFCIIQGLMAIILKKYIGQERSFQKLGKKYNNINKSKLTIFEGIYDLLLGTLFLTMGILGDLTNKTMFTELLMVSLLLGIVYYPLKHIFVGLK